MELLIDGGVRKACSSCEAVKPLKDFHKDKSNVKGFGRTYYCKECANRKSRGHHKRRMDNKDVEYRRKKRSSYLASTYGVTLEEYEAMVIKQGCKCAICNVSIKKSGSKTHLDHCHTTGLIRGMLCDNCNRGLGYFYDKPDVLESAAGYLKHYNKKFGLIKEDIGL